MKKLVVILITAAFLFAELSCILAEEGAALTDDALTPIMGEGSLQPEQMYWYLIQNNDDNGLNPITDDYAREFVVTTIIEARNEGVNYDIAFALMMHETGFLNFGGDVLPAQNNFGGLGATGGGVVGADFSDMSLGIRAVIQHLKCYASEEKLNEKCVDPRFSDKLRGKSVYLEWLGYNDNPNGTGWAYPGDGYGNKIKSMINIMDKIDVSDINKIDIPKEKPARLAGIITNVILALLVYGALYTLKKAFSRQ